MAKIAVGVVARERSGRKLLCSEAKFSKVAEYSCIVAHA